MEDRTDNLNQLVVDLGKSIEANTHAVQEQTATVERSFRELARGIQLIRDKQVFAAFVPEFACKACMLCSTHVALCMVTLCHSDVLVCQLLHGS